MIYVNSGKVSQLIYTRITAGSVVRNTEFNAYLLFENGKKEFLTASKNKTKLFRKLSGIAGFFKMDIIDNTA